MACHMRNFNGIGYEHKPVDIRIEEKSKWKTQKLTLINRGFKTTSPKKLKGNIFFASIFKG